MNKKQESLSLFDRVIQDGKDLNSPARQGIIWGLQTSNLSDEAKAEKLTLFDKLTVQEQSMSQEKALELAAKIRPVMSSVDGEIEMCFSKGKPLGKKFWVDSVGIHTQSYTFTRKKLAKAKGLKTIAEITTYHKCGYYGLLKPSVHEVLYQIPEEYLDKVTAFELYMLNDMVAAVYDVHLNRHALKCILYTGEVPTEIANRPVDW